jgi:hypothetical protein
MRVRAAVVEDAPAMGRVMVASFLSAHRGQMPDAAWQKRVDEWTPEVSARGWARAIAEQGGGNGVRDVVLVAEDDDGALCALVSGTASSQQISRPEGSTRRWVDARSAGARSTKRAICFQAPSTDGRTSPLWPAIPVTGDQAQLPG